jgi:hypothetical protein
MVAMMRRRDGFMINAPVAQFAASIAPSKLVPTASGLI